MESIVNGYFVPTVGFEEDMVVLVLVDSLGFRVDWALTVVVAVDVVDKVVDVVDGVEDTELAAGEYKESIDDL